MEDFPNKLKLARLASGLTQAEVAARLGVTKQAYGKYERGLVAPNSSRLLHFSKLLGKDVSFFLAPQRVDVDSFSFRKRSALTGKRLHSVRAEVVDKVERALALEEALGLDQQLDRKVLKQSSARLREAGEAVDGAARKLREEWDIGTDPIPSLRDLLREKGARVIELELDADFDGLSSVIGDTVSLIVINKHGHRDEVRQRFTLAHELGHLLLDVDEDISEATAEKICHRFASAFLLPPDSLRTELGGRRSAISLTELKAFRCKWGISGAAVVYAAQKANLIPESFAKRYWQLRRRDEDVKLERGWGGYPAERCGTNYLEVLGARAIQQDVMSTSRVASLLQRSISEVRQLAQDPTLVHAN